MKRPPGRVLRVTFALPGQWDTARYDARRERQASGRSSLRVSKRTAYRLRELARRVADLHPGRMTRCHLSVDELLDALADPRVRLEVRRRGKHAKKGSRRRHVESMPSVDR